MIKMFGETPLPGLLENNFGELKFICNSIHFWIQSMDSLMYGIVIACAIASCSGGPYNIENHLFTTNNGASVSALILIFMMITYTEYPSNAS